ncbi:hypothetical protein [Streptomyces subrutilus]|uniref:Uncharacterized protein n=1 Tax=Streptomyces subrutilus TaxID=36818 RepID=A0A1E5NXS4_9ACTN|nr:hypothetical protein [Streptomyces subrutilus]OEJ21066.1 hypothetical protein BGK67_34805 [Streptomyces subrutilus]
MSNIDDLLGPGYGRIVAARKSLEQACVQVVEMAQDVEFGPLGTDELAVAVATLKSSEYVDEDESGARWVSRAFTADFGDLIAHGEAALAFGGAVFMLRGALNELDAAILAADPQGPLGPGGTFSAR